jgi:hypothetical protein
MTHEWRSALIVPRHLATMNTPAEIGDIGQNMLRLPIVEAITVRSVAARERLTKDPLAPLIDLQAEQRPTASFPLPDARQFHDGGAHHRCETLKDVVEYERRMRFVAKKTLIGRAVAVVVHNIAPWHGTAGIAARERVAMVGWVQPSLDVVLDILLAILAGKAELLTVHLSAEIVNSLATDHPAPM